MARSSPAARCPRRRSTKSPRATKLTNITAFRLELIPDATLPGGGSGRGAGGKGVVTLFEVKTGGRKVDLARITADFKSEESELDLVIRPADQLKRGWGVNPETNKPHYAVIEPARMIVRSSANSPSASATNTKARRWDASASR